MLSLTGVHVQLLPVPLTVGGNRALVKRKIRKVPSEDLPLLAAAEAGGVGGAGV